MSRAGVQMEGNSAGSRRQQDKVDVVRIVGGGGGGEGGGGRGLQVLGGGKVKHAALRKFTHGVAAAAHQSQPVEPAHLTG